MAPQAYVKKYTPYMLIVALSTTISTAVLGWGGVDYMSNRDKVTQHEAYFEAMFINQSEILNNQKEFSIKHDRLIIQVYDNKKDVYGAELEIATCKENITEMRRRIP